MEKKLQKPLSRDFYEDIDLDRLEQPNIYSCAASFFIVVWTLIIGAVICSIIKLI